MSESLSIATCSDLLGMGLSTTYELVRSGLIGGVAREQKNGREVLRVPRFEIDRFLARFACGSALKEGTSLNAAGVTWRLKVAGLDPVWGGKSGQVRSSVFERTPEFQQVIRSIQEERPLANPNEANAISPKRTCLEAPLVARPLWCEGESLPGYLLRIAEENRLRDLSGLLKRTGLTRQLALQLSFAGVHAWLSGTAPAQAARSRSASETVWTRSKVCVSCLRECGYRHASWDLALRFTCSVHSTALEESCTCGRYIGYASGGLFHCACGKDYRHLEVEPAPQWAKTIEEVLHIGAIGRDDVELNAESAVAAHRGKVGGLRALTHLCSSSISNQLPVSHLTRRLDARRDTLALQALVHDWPTGFRGLIGPRLAALSREEKGRLRQYCQSLRGTPLWEVMQEIDGGLQRMLRTRPKGNPIAVAIPPSSEHVPLGQIADTYEVSWDSACKLFDENCFVGAAEGIGAAGRDGSRWVHSDELVIALAVRRDTMSFEETANFMGCEAHDVAGLVKGKHLAVATVPRRLTRPRVQVSEALRFLNGLQSRARPTSADDGELLALSDLRAFHGRDLQRSWLKLIERIRVRSIPLMLLEDQPTGFHSYGVRWSDVPTYLRPSRQTPPPAIAPTSGARAAELSDALCAAVL
jgi:hypothetical protein